MIIKAFAKINWSLDILGVRPDGYHLMDMLMQPVSFGDELTFQKADSLSLTTGGYPHCRPDESNLALKAARCLKEAAGCSHGASIHLQKAIPIGAGLGGGSADAAAVLFGLNRLWETGLSSAELETLGLSLGADVPFCLRGGLSRTGGIGESLENHPFKTSFWLLVFQPCRGLSTKVIFEQYRHTENIRRPDTPGLLHALETGDAAALPETMANVLEPVSAALCPEIPEAVSLLLANGAFAAQMTGSGSAVFGVFRSRLLAEKARKSLSAKYRHMHLCHTQSDSLRILED